ncbi:hypothetical protein [Aliiroseovarius sp.]|uniref:hypothetical protein n=1 Tax=Aliiroseovarius sp. TaxID=1872442 RepID=UPI003BA84EA9
MKKLCLALALSGSLAAMPMTAQAAPYPSSSNNNNGLVVGLVVIAIVGIVLSTQGIGSGRFSAMDRKGDDGREKGRVLQEF